MSDAIFHKHIVELNRRRSIGVSIQNGTAVVRNTELIESNVFEYIRSMCEIDETP